MFVANLEFLMSLSEWRRSAATEPPVGTDAPGSGAAGAGGAASGAGGAGAGGSTSRTPLEMCSTTMHAMANGGIHDHIGYVCSSSTHGHPHLPPFYTHFTTHHAFTLGWPLRTVKSTINRTRQICIFHFGSHFIRVI